MNRLTSFALIFSLVAAAVSAQEDDGSPLPFPVGVIRVGCGGIMAVRMLEPRAFGGLMLRGHGPVLMARSVPLVTRVTIGDEDGIHTVSRVSVGGSSFMEGDAERIVRSLDSLFSLGHPLSLFHGDLSELDKWHEARMKALAALHAEVVGSLSQGEEATRAKLPAGQEDAPEVKSSDAEGRELAAVGAASSTDNVAVGDNANVLKTSVDRDAEGSSLNEESLGVKAPVEVDVSGDGDQLVEMEWTPTNICGAVLLGMAFALLVSMLMLSLASLIYGCSEGSADVSVEEPLLKVQEAAIEGAPSVENPLCKYEPPAGKM